MAEKSTYIKLDRNMRFWRWFKNPKTVLVWIWLIMNANIEDHDFERETIHRGEIATSRNTISSATGLTENEVRTALNHLKSTGEITSRARPKYQVITILRYSDYQDVHTGKRTGRAPANHRQATGKSPQSKNGKNEKNGKHEKEVCVHTPPSRVEVEEFCQSQGLTTDVDAFIQYNSAMGWKIGRTKVEDWRPLLMKWVSHDDSASENNQSDELDEFGRPIRKEFE